MKKFLVMLMVVAMASFLFVGCLGDGVIPDVDDEEDEEPVVPTTVTPIIQAVLDAADGYVNKAEAADGVRVNGTAPTFSEVKIYIDGICAGTADVGVTGVFNVDIATADLGADGAKTLYATATETGLAESVHSNEIKFTLDTVAPTITKCSAKAGLSETRADLDLTADSHGLFDFQWWWLDDADLLVGGIWKIQVIGMVGFEVTLEVTDPNLVTTPWVFDVFATGWETYQFIPGVDLQFQTNVTSADVGAYSYWEVTAPVVAVEGYIDVTFDEDVTGASLLAGPWTAFGATEDLLPDVAVRSATTARLTETLGTEWAWWFAWRDVTNLAPGVAYSVSVSGITDLAGNSIPASAPETCMGVVML